MSDQAKLDRGARAEALLRNELFNEAFSSVREHYLKKLEDWPLSDSDGAQQLRMMLQLLRDVRATIDSAVRDGKVAALRIEDERRALSPAEWSGIPRTGTYGP